MVESSEDTAAQVALAIDRDRNRELLARLLSAHDVVDVAGAVPDGTDLCLVDAGAFRQANEEFDAWVTDQRPTFAPVMLLVEETKTDPWERYADQLSDAVDAIIQIPAPKRSITARIGSLLEMRELSRDLVSEHQLTELIFDTSPLAKLVVDTDETVVRANNRAAEVLDLSKSELRECTYVEDDWTPVAEDGSPIPHEQLPFAQVLDTGTPVYDYEYALERPDSERLWLSVNAAPIRDEDGAVEYVVGILEDVTVERRQQRELERQHDLFERAQVIASVGAVEFDVRTDEAYWTDEIAQIFDLETDVDPSVELALEQVHPEDRPVIQSAFERAVETGDPYDLELRLLEDDGDQPWVRILGEPQFEDGEVVALRGAIQNVTARKEREIELTKMTDAVDRAPIGVTLTDPTQPENPLVYANDAYVAITGYDRADMLGRNCRLLQGPDTDPETVAQIRQAIDDERPVSVRIKNYRADGTEFWNRLNVAPVRDDDGQVMNYIGFQQDVTEQVERERQLDILDRYLRHNLRNKLTVVTGVAEQIQAEGSPRISGLAERIETTADELLESVEKERTVAAILKSEPVLRTVELSSVLSDAAEQIRDAHPRADVSVSCPDDVVVEATDQLSTAVLELLDNAIRHAENPSPTVTVAVTPADDEVVIEVVDDGPGIPDMEVDVLTGAKEETAVYHGQGLGLWLVHLIVRQCGGRLDFERHEDEDEDENEDEDEDEDENEDEEGGTTVTVGLRPVEST